MTTLTKSALLRLLHCWLAVRCHVTSLQARLVLGLWGVRPGPGFCAHGRLRLWVAGHLVIGAHVRIHSGPTNFVGGDRRMALWVSKGGVLDIGDGCALSNSTIVCKERIDILSGTYIGGGCEIFDHDFHAIDPIERIAGRPGRSAPVCIGPYAFLGAGVRVLKGATIGEGAVIGAGSVVTRTVPAYEIWAGSPARAVGCVKRSVANPEQVC